MIPAAEHPAGVKQNTRRATVRRTRLQVEGGRPWRSFRRCGGVAVGLLAVLILTLPTTAAAIPEDNHGGPGQNCDVREHGLRLVGAPVLVGLPLANSSVQVNAANAKIVATRSGCPSLLIAIPTFRWSVIGDAPGLAATTLSGTETLTPTASLGPAGMYQIRLSVCPQKCNLRVGHLSQTFGPASADLSINARNEIVLPPETQPTVRTFNSAETTVATPFSQSERDRKCNGGGGFVDPQWVTTRPFNGVQDHQLAEGRVFRSLISSQDNPLNHDSQDFEWEMALDPPFRYLSRPGRQSLDVEWESDHVARIARPSPGDRNWVAGYWIFDCGHFPFGTEIHPPVGTASSRYRRIDIPASFRSADTPNQSGSQVSLGSNIKVPGVSTDIWFNRTAGETTNSCDFTTLHQPASLLVGGKCIREPNPVNRAFTFNIYLPRDPQIRLQTDLGITAPPVPLFVETVSGQPGGGGPDPTIVVRRQGPATWLEVTVNPGTATNYFRRIYAAWALPAADNWSLRRWRLQLKSLDVHSDKDPDPPFFTNKGDWRLLLDTNNRDQEWTSLLNCDGCVNTGHTKTFASTFRTGDGGRLGPDLTVFPDQFVLVATNGFDDDVAADDDVGSIYDAVLQSDADAACRNNGCRFRSGSSGGEYDLNYTLRPGRPVQPAILTSAGKALFNAYVVRAGTNCTPVAAGCFVAPGPLQVLETNWLPRTKWVAPGSRTCSTASMPVFEPAPREEFVLTGISLDRMAAELRQLRARNPRAYRRLLAELRSVARATPRSEVYPLISALGQTVPTEDRPDVLPLSLRERNAVRPVPLQPPAQRVPLARALFGPCG